jgi:hypothetical protein
MKNYLTVTASLLAGVTLMLAGVPAVAATVDVNIGIPGVVVQPQPVYVHPRPVYVQPQYESDWRDRNVRATSWRDNPSNHGQVVSANAHARNDIRKSKHKKNKHNKHHGKH